MTEICAGEIEEVNNYHNFAENWVIGRPEHNPDEMKDVKENKMSTDSCSRIASSFIAAEKMSNKRHLQEPQDNPVNSDKYGADAERR